MKQLYLITLTLFLLLGQWSSLDHVYHDHESGMACDYCLSAQPLDHVVPSFSLPEVSEKGSQWPGGLAQKSIIINNISYYSVRAPPRFI